MTPAAATAIGRTARVVLLLATALGLALMHTLGHSGVRTDSHAVVMETTTTAITSGPCPDGHCDGHGGHDAWSVCLAILAGLAAVMLLLWLFTAVCTRRPVRARSGPRTVSPRAPPDRTAGLTLASAAVLRI